MLGRSLGGGNGNPLQYSCLWNLMNRGAWQATVCGVTKQSDITALSTFPLWRFVRSRVEGLLGKALLIYTMDLLFDCTLESLKEHDKHWCLDPPWPGFPGASSDKDPTSQCRRPKRCRFNPWVRKIPWRRKWQPTSVFLPENFHGQRSLAGYSLWGHKESDMTKWLTLSLGSLTLGSNIKSSLII